MILETQSVCPVCLERLDAHRVIEGDSVYLEKRCPQHGEFRTIVWRGPPALERWVGPDRPPSFPLEPQTPVARGCPFDCGLCAEHRQKTCCVLLEVTQRCNLRCPVCFASAGEGTIEPSLEALEARLRELMRQGGPFNLQLSGGEPTLRDDLPELIARGRRLGFDFFQLNTNGLRLARDEAYARALKGAGLGCVFLQFDGLDDGVFRRLRGVPLLETKLAAIARCAELGLGVVLVPTVVPGVNDGALGALVRFAIAHAPTVRGVHVQPISYFGRYPQAPADGDRLTLPEVMQALERQTGGLVHASDFRPPSAENAQCSFSATYELGDDGSLHAPRSTGCCCAPRPGAEAQAARKAVARRWVHPEGAPPGEPSPGTASLDAFLARARRNTFSISAMAFQDAWTLDLERLKDCHIHVVDSERLVPFCAFNLTAQHGGSPYRGG